MFSMLAPRFLNVGLRALAMVSRFALVFVLAKLFNPAEVGLFGIFLVTVSFSVLALGGEFYTYSQRELLGSPRKRWSFVLQHQALALGVFYLFLMPIQLLLFSYELLPAHLMLWFFSILITEHLAQEINRLLVAMQRPLTASIIIFLRMGAWVWFVLPFMWLNPNQQSLETVFFAWFVGGLLAVIVGLYIVWREATPWRFWPVDYSWLKRGFSVGLLFLMSTLAFKALFTVDRYTVEYLTDPELLGVYVLYSGMAMVVINFLDPAVFSFLYPRMVRAYSQGDMDAYRDAMKELIWSTLGVSIIIILLTFIIAPFVLQWIDRGVYLEHLPMLSLLLIVAFIYAMGMIPHYGLYAIGKDRPIIAAHLSSLFVFSVVTFSAASSAPFQAVVYGLIAALSWTGCLKLFYYKKASLSLCKAEYVCSGEKG